MAETGLDPGQGLLAACSGGPDSTALVDLLARWSAERGGPPIIVASFDHGLRPEAAEEVAQVAALARSLGLEFVSGRAERSDYGGHSSQDKARRLRLDWLTGQVRALGLAALATGHNQDDQAETVIMRLIRGSGSTGLGAMSPRAERDGVAIIRPLLTISRAEILAYLDRRGLGYVTDPSNAQDKYLRSRVRHRILPRLTAENPNLAQRLADLADLLRDEDDLLSGLADQALADSARLEPDRVTIDRTALTKVHPALARRVVRAAYRHLKGDLLRLTAVHVNDVLQAAQDGRGLVRLPGGWRAEAGAEAITIRPVGSGQPSRLEPVSIPGPGRYPLSTGWEIIVEAAAEPAPLPSSPDQALFDADALAWPLTVRPPRPGDRISPWGLGGHKKLADVFIDAKVHRAERASWPVLESGGRIIWLAGLVRADLAAVTPDTPRTIKLTLVRRGKAGKH